MFGTMYENPYDLLDDIMNQIGFIISNSPHENFLNALNHLFFLCHKYNIPTEALDYINALENNFVHTIYTLPFDENPIIDTYFNPFKNSSEDQLNTLKNNLLQEIKSYKDTANNTHTLIVTISTISGCLGIASLGLLLITPIPYIFMIGSALIALGIISFAIGSIIQYFKQMDYQQDVTFMESLKRC